MQFFFIKSGKLPDMTGRVFAFYCPWTVLSAKKKQEGTCIRIVLGQVNLHTWIIFTDSIRAGQFTGNKSLHSIGLIPLAIKKPRTWLGLNSLIWEKISENWPPTWHCLIRYIYCNHFTQILYFLVNPPPYEFFRKKIVSGGGIRPLFTVFDFLNLY